MEAYQKVRIDIYEEQVTVLRAVRIGAFDRPIGQVVNTSEETWSRLVQCAGNGRQAQQMLEYLKRAGQADIIQSYVYAVSMDDPKPEPEKPKRKSRRKAKQ